MNVLAIEVSTSSAKALIFSVREGIKGVCSIPYSNNVSDVVTQDPDGIYRTLIECARNLIERVDCPIDGIGLGSTWHSLLFLDRHRKPAGRIKTWANTEAAPTAYRYRRDEELKLWFYRKTGCMVHSIYPVWKYIHVKQQGYRELDSEGYLSSQAEYVFEKLTGEVAVSTSIASGTGFMNIHTLEWDQEILDFAGVKKSQLAPIFDLEYTAPLNDEAAKELGLKPGTPVVLPGPDGALNQVGAGAMEEGIMTMSVGTSGAIRLQAESQFYPGSLPPGAIMQLRAKGWQVLPFQEPATALSGLLKRQIWAKWITGRWMILLPELTGRMLRCFCHFYTVNAVPDGMTAGPVDFLM